MHGNEIFHLATQTIPFCMGARLAVRWAACWARIEQSYRPTREPTACRFTTRCNHRGICQDALVRDAGASCSCHFARYDARCRSV